MYLSRTSNSAGKTRARELTETLIQIVALAYGLHGLDMVYGPAAYMVGALIVIAAIEVR